MFNFKSSPALSVVFRFPFAACDVGHFGEQCVEMCHCAENVTCNAVSGDCPSGCADGWTGPSCSDGIFTSLAKTIGVEFNCMQTQYACPVHVLA